MSLADTVLAAARKVFRQESAEAIEARRSLRSERETFKAEIRARWLLRCCPFLGRDQKWSTAGGTKEPRSYGVNRGKRRQLAALARGKGGDGWRSKKERIGNGGRP